MLCKCVIWQLTLCTLHVLFNIRLIQQMLEMSNNLYNNLPYVKQPPGDNFILSGAASKDYFHD